MYTEVNTVYVYCQYTQIILYMVHSRARQFLAKAEILPKQMYLSILWYILFFSQLNMLGV